MVRGAEATDTGSTTTCQGDGENSDRNTRTPAATSLIQVRRFTHSPLFRLHDAACLLVIFPNLWGVWELGWALSKELNHSPVAHLRMEVSRYGYTLPYFRYRVSWVCLTANFITSLGGGLMLEWPFKIDSPGDSSSLGPSHGDPGQQHSKNLGAVNIFYFSN